MSYADEKSQIERKIKRAKRIALCAVAVIVALLCVFAYFWGAEGWKYNVGLPSVSARKSGEMRVHFIDVGQGDCTLIEFPDGQTMLVDGGDASERSVGALLRYCNALSITTVNHLVVTHANYDHYGGLFTFLDYKRVVNAYLPYGQELVNARYAELYQKLTDKGVTKTYTRRDTDILIDGCTLAFMYPSAYEADNASAVLWLDYAGVSVLLTGDMEADTESFCISEDKIGGFDAHAVDLRDTEILKVAHHGSAYSTSEAFVDYIGVETAVISCGAGNAYGHPSQTALDTLAQAGAEIYRTDTHGHICITVRPDGSYTTDFC